MRFYIVSASGCRKQQKLWSLLNVWWGFVFVMELVFLSRQINPVNDRISFRIILLCYYILCLIIYSSSDNF